MVIADEELVSGELERELASDWPCGWESEEQQPVDEDTELASDWPCN
jgi:hypothetical protein